MYGDASGTHTMNPKIPDGKSMLSSGLKHQESFAVSEDASEGLTIIMYPGVNSGIFINGGTDSRTTTTYSNGIQFANDYSQTGDNITQWRSVSQLLKVELVNAEETNDGWWQAARLRLPADSHYFAGSPSGVASRTVLPTNEFPYYDINQAAIANNPTFTTGALKDIGSERFVLAPASREHEFKRLDLSPGTAIPEEQLVDDSFDCIIIQIFGNTNAGTGNSRLHLHHMANHEYIYAFDTREHALQTKSYDYPALVKKVRHKHLKWLTKASIKAHTFYKRHQTEIRQVVDALLLMGMA